jgi:hypothetical protein
MDKTTQNKKKQYEKPSVKRYPLRPEEAVLGFCKNSSSAGSTGGTCFNPTACMTIGS